MGLINLLGAVSVTSFGDGFGAAKLSYEWVCKIIGWIVNFAGDVGLGIILFTLALKLITLPLDIYSRASMRKNSLKMEAMKPELEKLQKQYANNKQLYQQKMMALYKKNGYSAMSACLPTIVTLVFFFIVLGGFNSYSRFNEKEVFNEMGRAYSASVESFADRGILVKEGEAYIFDLNAVLKEEGLGSDFIGYGDNVNTDTEAYSIDISSFSTKTEILEKYSLGNYFKDGHYNYDNETLTSLVNADVQKKLIDFIADESLKQAMDSDGIINLQRKEIINFNEFFSRAPANVQPYFKNAATDGEEANYVIDFGKFIEDNLDVKDEFEQKANKAVSSAAVQAVAETYRRDKVLTEARKAAADAYYNNHAHSKITFWVKNLWVVDSPFSRALPTYSGFKSSMRNKSENIGGLTESAYDEITYNLGDEKLTGFGKGNGYFILVALSILAMLGATIINNRTQKAQVQLSTVDGANGTAASTQKMMMWMMPLMFGIFAFIYSASFSLYMITSTVISTLSTVTINLCVEKSFKKKIEKEQAEKAEKQKYGKRR